MKGDIILNYVIRTHGLTKVFNGSEVVSQVDLHVAKSQIYGFLGPNGAGKTTVMRMITMHRHITQQP